jgi:hypothetical protein
MDLPRLPSGLIRASDVRTAGLASLLARELAVGRLTRVKRGIYAPALPPGTPEWKHDHERYRRLVLAAGHTMGARVFTGFSALMLHGLPTYGRWPEDVYVMSAGRNGGRRAGVVSVAGSYEPKTTNELALPATSIEFTLIQVCRDATLAAALAGVDAALKTSRSGPGAPRTTLERLRAEHDRLLPYPGSRRVEAVLARATTGADSVLETASRLVIEELGFEAPELQRRFWTPELHSAAFADFWWPSVSAIGEADGRGKYLGPRSSNSQREARSSADEPSEGERVARAVIDEKERENALRRQVRAFDRWDWGDMARKAPIEARLLRMGVPRTRPRRALIGPPTGPASRHPARVTQEAG